MKVKSEVLYFLILRFKTRNTEEEMFRRCKFNDSEEYANSGVLIRVRETTFNRHFLKTLSLESGGDWHPERRPKT